MRPRLAAHLALLAALSAGLAWAPAVQAGGRKLQQAANPDQKELKRFTREIADDRRDLEQLRARVRRVEALLAMREVDLRAVDELDVKVHEEMLKEAKEQLLAGHAGLGATARVAEAARGAPPSYDHDKAMARVDQITVAWAALRGKATRLDLERRRALLLELVEIGEAEVEDDLRIFHERGGDTRDIPTASASGD